MAAPNEIIATATDSWGRTVVLSQERWEHVVEGHRQLDGYELAVVTAIEKAEERRRGNFKGAEVLYRRDLGPARWLAVVVAYDGSRGKVITAYPCTSKPKAES